jgi:hypothetical protein
MQQCHFKRLLCIAGLCGDVHVGKALEQAAEAGADQGVIVDDENAHGQRGCEDKKFFTLA